MGDEDSARIGLELFIELAEILPLFLTSHLEALLESIYTLTTDKKLESNILFCTPFSFLLFQHILLLP